MIVMKFGGTSVGDASRIRGVADLVASRRSRHPLVVVSALAGVTDRLVAAGEAARARDEAGVAEHLRWLRRRHLDVVESLELPVSSRDAARDAVEVQLARASELTRGVLLLGELTPRAQDALAAIGELLSHRLVALALGARGIDAEAVDPREIVRTSDRFGSAEVDREATDAAVRARVAPLLQRGVVAVTGGFVGATADGVTTTLGRGGSDLSATLLGVALAADEVEIWTDVDGILSADPRVVPTARTLERVSFQEAAELAYFGAKVLHPASIKPAVELGIPVRVLNSLRPEVAGTVVAHGEPERRDEPHDPHVRAVAWKKGIAIACVSSPRMLGATGFLARVFATFERHGTPVDVVTTSEVSVSMSVDRPDRLPAIARELETTCQVRVEEGLALACVVGRSLLGSPRLVADVLATLDPIPLRMFCLGSSDINLTFVVEERHAEDVVRRLHARFLEGATR